MTSALVSCLLVTVLAEGHVAANPVFSQLTSVGVVDGLEVKLPAPLLPDTLDGQQQQTALQELVPENKRDLFYRESLVAPQSILMNKTEDVSHLDQFGAIRRVDFWYIAYGDFEAIATDKFLESLGNEIGDDRNTHVLDQQQLEARGLSQDTEHERLGHAEFTMLKKVGLAGTGRSYWSQTDRSILAASKLDSRFLNDETIPNQWHALVRNESGELEPGSPLPYDGAGGYIKLTRVERVPRQIFVEGHFAFFEPTGWFRGANLLGAKLPAVIQKEARATRRAIAEASRSAAE